MSGYIPYLAILIVPAFLYVLHVFLLFLYPDIVKLRVKKGIFGYTLFYSDAKNSKRDKHVIYSKLLTSEHYGLSGKPDCILKSRLGKSLVPVEYKSGSATKHDAPFYGDLMQLAAYFLIIEDYFGVRPKFGRLVYSDIMFQIKNTKKLRNAVLETVENMKGMLDGDEYDAEPSYVKCRYCICRMTVCEHCNDDD